MRYNSDMREPATTREKITAIRLLIAIPAIGLSYLCLLALPVLVLFTIGSLNGAALTAGAPSSGSGSWLIRIPFITGAACSLIGLLVGPGWRSRLAALIPALCYGGFVAFVVGTLAHLGK